MPTEPDLRPISLHLPLTLRRQAEEAAFTSGQSLQFFIATALKEHLERREKKRDSREAE
jgi:hypothetical protein